MKEDILHSALKEVQLYGNFESHKAEIDAEDLSWILQILSTNLYSDPIGSLIREYSSNAPLNTITHRRTHHQRDRNQQNQNQPHALALHSAAAMHTSPSTAHVPGSGTVCSSCPAW